MLCAIAVIGCRSDATGRRAPTGGSGRDSGAVTGAPTIDAQATPPAPVRSEPEILTAWAAAIERDDGAAFVALIDPTYGVTVSYHFGMGDQLQDLVHVAGGASGPPSRMIGRKAPHTPAVWARRRWKSVAAVIETYLADARVDPSDVMGFMYGSCGRGRPASDPPLAAYLRHDRSDAGYHAFDDEVDGGPPVPPLTGLTVFGHARMEIMLRRSDEGWRVVRVIFNEHCASGPD